VKNRFRVIYSRPAQREIESLEIDTALRIAGDIKTYLETSPLPFGKNRIKKLTGFHPPLYRMRSGDFRVYYRIISTDVVVLAVIRKKDSEKALKKLKKISSSHH